MHNEEYSDINEMITDKNRHLSPDTMGSALDSRSNYSGTDLSEGTTWIGLAGRCRDNEDDPRVRSNWESILADLGHSEDGGKWVRCFRIGSWLGGWSEYLGIRHDAPKPLLKRALGIINALADYPILDEDHYSECEQQYRDDQFECNEGDFIRNIKTFLGIDDDNEDMFTDEEYEQCARALYEDECGYSGHEDAYVTPDDIHKSIECASYPEINPVYEACIEASKHIKAAA